MKPEPLKNKIRYLGTGSHGNDDIIFKMKDVKSAIEWFKENIRIDLQHGAESFNGSDWISVSDVEEIIDFMIDQAFEDVTK